MIDISDKKVIRREATACGTIFLKKSTIQKIKAKDIQKGDPLWVAKIAAIYGAKKTPELIPLAHQIPLEKIDTEFEIADDRITVRTTVIATAKTGVEMEALVGVTMALNTIWDMVKYLEKDEDGQYPVTKISDVMVLRKVKG